MTCITSIASRNATRAVARQAASSVPPGQGTPGCSATPVRRLAGARQEERRRVAAGYDKTAASCLAFVALVAIWMWL